MANTLSGTAAKSSSSIGSEPVSTSSIVRWVQAPTEAPLRVDFAGGWLDVPRFSRPGEFVVNCAISPLVSLREWPYEKQAGLGGSGAWALLNGRDGIESEIDLGVGRIGERQEADIRKRGQLTEHSVELIVEPPRGAHLHLSPHAFLGKAAGHGREEQNSEGNDASHGRAYYSIQTNLAIRDPSLVDPRPTP